MPPTTPLLDIAHMAVLPPGEVMSDCLFFQDQGWMYPQSLTELERFSIGAKQFGKDEKTIVVGIRLDQR